MKRLQIQSSDTRIGHRTESNYILFNNLRKISFNQSCNMHFIKFQINISDAFFFVPLFELFFAMYLGVSSFTLKYMR